MTTLYTRIHKFSLLIFFLLLVSSIQAQDIKLHIYYNQQVESKEFTLAEKETLIDSLLLQTNLMVNQKMLAEIYYDISRDYWNSSNSKKAIIYTKKVEDIAHKINDFEGEIFSKAKYNNAFFLYRTEQFFKALKSSKIYLKRYPKENLRLGKLYRTIGNIYSELGDFQKALDNYDRSISILKPLDEHKDLARTLICKLETLVSLYETSLSDEIFDIKDHLFVLKQKHKMSYLNKNAIDLNLGSYYDFLKDFLNANKNYSNVLKRSIEEQDSIDITKSYINLAVLNKKENNIEKAKKLLEEAAKHNTSDHSLISNNLADIFQKENNHKEALIYYQKAIYQALQLKENNYNELPTIENFKLIPNKIYLLGYLIDKANGWIAYYDAEGKPEYLENALETFTLADQLIDIIYVESREDLSKLFWRKKGATFYPKAVEVCYRLQQPEKAFFFMEKNKAMVLLENMTNATAKRLSKLPEHILIREQHLIKKIKIVESEIQSYTNKKSTLVDSLKNNVFNHKKEYAAFIDSLETNYPKYYNYKKTIKISTFQDVQKQLKNNELILQYIVGKEKGFVALIAAKSIQLKELPITSELTKTANAYKEAVSKPFVNEQDKNTYTTIAKKLYLQLIPFDNSELRLKQKRITIIADGILQYIPFEALLTSKGEYLIKSAEINYNYSLSSAAQSQQNTTSIPENFIAIAPTKFKNDQFGALATSEDELKRLTSIFGANHFQYEKATKKRFTEAYGNYKIVHLSTHGGINNTIPWMAFYDEKMTLDELYFTKNQSELVVLSACKTSDGELKKGEGVMSLARGFFNAGAKSVVSSLWDINEKASNNIIQEFYKNIINGDTKSEALQKAKIAYIQQNENTSEASPYYWSGLTITGDVRPIKGMQKHNYVYYGFASIILIIIGVSFRKKRQKAKAA